MASASSKIIEYLRNLTLDTRAARASPLFGRYLFASNLSNVGSQAAQLTVLLEIYQLKHSAFLVGLVGLARAAPYCAVVLFAGSAADVQDRRSLALLGTILTTAAALMMALQSVLGNRNVAIIYGVVALQSLFGALGTPSANALWRGMIPSDLISSGVSMIVTFGQASFLAGSLVGGTIANFWGVKYCFTFNVVSFLPLTFVLSQVPKVHKERVSKATYFGPAGMRTVLEGLSWMRSRPIVFGAFVADFSAMLFGVPYALFPSINAQRFGGSPFLLGVLLTAPGVGALVGAISSGRLSRYPRPGRILVLSTIAWGIAVVGFGLSFSLQLALACLFCAGFADNATVMCRMNIVQSLAPERLLGRVNAASGIIGATGPQLGNFESGSVAALTTVTYSAVSGGIITLIGVLVCAVTIPELTKYSRTTEKLSP